MPTTPMKAHHYDPTRDLHAIISHGWNMLGNTTPFDVTGHPALSVPCGFSNGLPIGLMLVGRDFDEVTLLAAGEAAMAATDTRAMRAADSQRSAVGD